MAPHLGRMHVHPRRLAIVVLLVLAAAPAHAQFPSLPRAQEPPPAEEPARAEEPPPAGALEVLTRYRMLSDSAAQAERLVERLGTVGGIRAELLDAQRRQAELQALLASLVEAEHVRVERLSRVRDQALLEDQRLEAIRGRVFERLDQLGEVRSRWLERRRLWRSWRQTLRGDPDLVLVAGDMGDALARIDTVLARSGSAVTELLALQRRVEELRVATEQIGGDVLAVRAERRDALLRRNEPVLLSPAHREQMRQVRLEEWQPLTLLRPAAYVAFVRDHTGVFLLHIVLALVIAFAARRLRRVAGPEGAWGGTLMRPWALGVFVSAALAMQRVTLAPPLWDVLLWSLFGATAAVLARGVLPTRALRLTVWLLGGIYPLLLLLEALLLPAPVLRVLLAIVAGAAVAAFSLAAGGHP
jgi:hypothetical protein